MKILEVRRHSIRHAGGDHLSQAGVALARNVGQNIGPFDFVSTSTLPRAFDTAIAMGFAVNEQNPLMNTYGGAVEREAPWPMPFFHYSEIVKQAGAAAKYAHDLMDYYLGILNHIPQGGSALVVNHGGVVELGVVACLPDADFSAWGDAVEYCEGARLFWDGGKFVNGEVLRLMYNKESL
ncbi:MAG TPA: phosphoglycerate mutase family protein [Anaerolineales bacterium]|nr:phosphoglycerate mutase family protein [Anaerolineales bacterium]HND47533.1 phosphoglycerate mutase family protein [Anaerolineales bacterium]HNH26326.1 phosphoglycerate mutase family protein [Anaerolineales bacterium]